MQVPNAASYQSRAFKGDWFALDAPRHRYHFSADRLERLLAETGFSVYRKTFFSKAHNAHALRQSLKARWWPQPSSRVLFYLSIPFLKPVDSLLSLAGKGATVTLAARAV